MNSCYFTKHYNRNTALPVWPGFFLKIVHGYTKVHEALSSVCNRSNKKENSIAAALCQQLAIGLLKTELLLLCHNSL
jgi:hypothetical protein